NCPRPLIYLRLICAVLRALRASLRLPIADPDREIAAQRPEFDDSGFVKVELRVPPALNDRALARAVVDADDRAHRANRSQVAENRVSRCAKLVLLQRGQ